MVGGVAVLGIALAAWVGSLFGSGAFNGEARFHAERWAAQQGAVVAYSTPEIYGHPGAGALENVDLIRQFVGLDGVN